MCKFPKTAPKESRQHYRRSSDLPSILWEGEKGGSEAIQGILYSAAPFLARHSGAFPSPDVLATTLIKLLEVIS